MAVHGYLRASVNKQRDAPDAQRDVIARYCQASKLGEPMWYADNSASGKAPLREREAGEQLMRNLRRGDHVVIAELDRAFRRLSDCVVILDQFDRTGVHLHVCNLLGQASELSRWIDRPMIQFLAVFADMERAFIAERSGQASRARRVRGEGVGRPPYGSKYEVRYRTQTDGQKQRYLKQVPDTYERAVMKMILRWRSEEPPWSWHEIYEKLNYELKLRTSDGREWDESRIRRACRAEAILQSQEVRDGRDRFQVLGESGGPTMTTDETAQRC